MKIITEEILVELIKLHGFENFLKDLISTLKTDFCRWSEFNLIPRPAMHVPDGVLELMPVCDKDIFTFKYVNCHPKNITSGKMTVVATGQLASVDSGYPLLFSEMTLLTALRTAATTAIATDLMSRKDSRTLSIIGTGAQSEFLVTGIGLVRNIQEVRYFDTDPLAMDKFEKNFAGSALRLVRCKNAEEAARGADIITTCTACRKHVDVLKNDWVKPGVHINGIGGDSRGKTELELAILSRGRIVVEYLDQCKIEGEIQRFGAREIEKYVHAELHELISGEKTGRDNRDQITIYDSVGIALEDFSALRMTFDLANRCGLGQELNFVPELKNVKNLISLVA